MSSAFFRRLNRQFLSINLASFKASLQKVLASFLCLLLFNAAIGCWQHAIAQPNPPIQQQHADMQMMPCHQLQARHQLVPNYQLDQSDLTAFFLSGSHVASTEHSTHGVVNHACALNCSAFTSPTVLAQQTALISSLLPASKPAELTVSPLQAWRQNPERPPQFLI